MSDRDKSLHVLQHALGLDDYGQGEAYRNHYVCGPGHHGYDLCMAHVEAGRMVRSEPREKSPEPTKLTRAQKRYREWLRADCGMEFVEWLKEMKHA